jgi:hypothetical protein
VVQTVDRGPDESGDPEGMESEVGDVIAESHVVLRVREEVAGRSLYSGPLVTPPVREEGKPTRRAFGPLAEAHRGRR